MKTRTLEGAIQYDSLFFQSKTCFFIVSPGFPKKYGHFPATKIASQEEYEDDFARTEAASQVIFNLGWKFFETGEN